MNKNYTLPLAALLGFLGVALGAFGAHALRGILTDQGQTWWATAVEYHLVHAVALLALALSTLKSRVAAWGWGIGVLLFSGSLYLMALTGWTWLGMVTPLGGVLLLVGWGALMLRGWLYIKP